MKKLISAIVTKFDEKGNLVLDEDYKNFLEKLIEDGVNAFMVCGTNGEFHAMNVEERKKLLEFVVENFKGKIEIIAHTGSTNLGDTMKLTDHALSLGVDYISIVAPYYFKYDSKALTEYFVGIAKNFKGAKILLYNIPSFTGNRIEFEHILEIKEKAPNIVGMKDSDRRPQIVAKLKEVLGDDFIVYGGMDDLVVHYLAMGADGQVSGTSNVFPKILRRVLDDFDSGNYESAFHHQKILNRIVENVSGHRAFVGANKFALKILGFDLGYPRSPSRVLDEDEKTSVEKFLREVEEWSI
jgi:4-hydroxy-tetrahydrodipicolinate synthase